MLANYPNPFNPETWIPYELATDTDVRLTIYNAQGVVIRTLQLGQQSAGYYTDRDRAAYWDGRNSPRGTGGEWCLFLPVRDGRNVVPAENGDFEIVSYDHRSAGMLMSIRLPALMTKGVKFFMKFRFVMSRDWPFCVKNVLPVLCFLLICFVATPAAVSAPMENQAPVSIGGSPALSLQPEGEAVHGGPLCLFRRPRW